jgi:hypothetical protein
MVTLNYGIKFDKSYGSWITVDSTKYDEETHLPILWGVRRGSSIMSKYTGEFDYEPMPSQRDDDFFKEYRFDSPNEAKECYLKFNP